MESDYSVVLPGGMFAKPYGEYFQNDSSVESRCMCSHCGDVIDSQSVCFVAPASTALW